MSTFSIVAERGGAYPDEGDWYSPGEPFPEYRQEHLSSAPNPVYRDVRRCFAQAGLDAERFGRAEWNPLGRWIKPGSNVFILCNFVYHRRPRESLEGLWGKCTHGSLLRPVIDYALLANQGKGRVLFGNAPLQSCNWSRVLQETGAATVQEFYSRRSIDVRARDLRMLVTERTALGRMIPADARDEKRDCRDVDLGKSSLLTELYKSGTDGPRFRINDYDIERMRSSHSAEHHTYLVHRDVLDSDVIICVPKLKTHEKVGLTCNLKGYVGIVGHKDCLAHHRFGDPGIGGDEYPRGLPLRRAISTFDDWVQTRSQAGPLSVALEIGDRALRTLLRRAGATVGGAWHGNDTAWRMALDLARIATYADREGVMRESPQRVSLSLVDGVIGGEGEGPLAPKPVRSGVILFGDDVVATDWIACRLMGYDANAVPLVREAFRPMAFPLASSPPNDWSVWQDGKKIPASEVGAVLPRPFRAPRGWREHLAQGGRK